MLRKLVVVMGIVAGCGLAVGCGGSSSTGGTKPSGERGTMDKIKEGAGAAGEKISDATKEGVAKLKEGVVKPIIDSYPKIEEKIKTMSGDAAKAATEKFDALKKLVEEFKTADKWEDMKEKLVKAFDDLKKSVGL
jgi:hypothetical protein